MFASYSPALVDYIHLIDEFPVRGGHAVVKQTYKMPGGAGANVAHNLANLGVDSVIFTALGKDDDAEFFIANTKARVVASRTDEYTGKVDVFVDRDGERTFFVYPNAAGKPYIDVEPADYLYLDPFPSGDSFELQLKAAKNCPGFVILNPGFPYTSIGFEKLSPMLRYVDMIIMSEHEFERLNVDLSDVLKFVDYVIITKGEGGSSCYTKDSEFHAKAVKTKVVDTTGAGDAFAAGFIYCFMKDLPLKVCLEVGNFCGAYNVSRVGARNFPNAHQIEKFLASILRSRSK